MARKKEGVNKSEEIRQLLTANPEMRVKEVVATLADRDIKVTDTLVYFIKGKMTGKKAKRMKARQIVSRVAATAGNSDPVSTILKVRCWADEVGGIKKLKALVDVLSD